MRQLLGRRPRLDLERRLQALKEAVEYADGRLDQDLVAQALRVFRRAGQRLGLGPELTVVALAGATGSGKSSLFNLLAGAPLSEVGVRRPTTAETHACVWGELPADPLLEWLGVRRRHLLGGTDAELDGMVLLDLPDHDSTEVSHRQEVDRLVELVDLLVWVLDPQKYADAAIHERYLRPLADHAEVMVVVFNHADRLEEGALRTCLSHLSALLREDGLEGVPVIATSARTREGMEDLRELLGRRVAAKRASSERLSADVDSAIRRLGYACDGDAGPPSISRRARDTLVDALSHAAGTDVVAVAVSGSYLHRAKKATGWPLTRWLRRLRPDPLSRLHLGQQFSPDARTSLPEPSEVQRAEVGRSLRRVAMEASAGLPQPWPSIARRTATRHETELPERLDRLIAGTGLGEEKKPKWWTVMGLLQGVFLAAAAAGAVWLLLLFGLEWLRLPDPPLYRVREIPLPTLLLVGGLLAGLLLAGLSRWMAGMGARRRAAAARRRLRQRVESLADEAVMGPLGEELSVYHKLCGALARARR